MTRRRATSAQRTDYAADKPALSIKREDSQRRHIDSTWVT
jgi:hypothetical protein